MHWFDSLEDFQAALNSDVWQRVIEDVKEFLDVENAVMTTVGDETLRH